MPPLPILKPQEVVRVFERLGYIRHRQTGSHLILAHPDNHVHHPVIPLHNKDLKRGTLRAIIRQSGMTVDEFLKLL
ncbi:type II toxin-antitoxin system HicA family toxin [Candidatus Uhrbacteria bacterium]|nr:type II toxin-antitoxin system HicA family toxin [Candidatus Uhrbacteria bacterium]